MSPIGSQEKIAQVICSAHMQSFPWTHRYLLKDQVKKALLIPEKKKEKAKWSEPQKRRRKDARNDSSSVHSVERLFY